MFLKDVSIASEEDTLRKEPGADIPTTCLLLHVSTLQSFVMPPSEAFFDSLPCPLELLAFEALTR